MLKINIERNLMLNIIHKTIMTKHSEYKQEVMREFLIETSQAVVI